MSGYIKGKGSKFFLGTDDTTPLTESDYITRVTNLGEQVSEFNMIDVEPDLLATTQEKIAGLKLARTFTVTGNLTVEDNIGYNTLKTVHDNQKLVKYGITRPQGLDGIGGYCYVNKLQINEATNEGILTYSADITATGDDELFELPIV